MVIHKVIEVVQNFLFSFSLCGLLATLVILYISLFLGRITFFKIKSLWQKGNIITRAVVLLFVFSNIVYGGGKANLLRSRVSSSNYTTMLTIPQKAKNWNLRGAWRDIAKFNFANNWEFPYTTNAITSIGLISYGEIWPGLKNTNAIATLGEKVEIVRDLTSFSCEYTPYNSYRFTWVNAAINRDTNNLLTASIELFSNGDVFTVTNGIASYQERINPYDIDGDGLANELDAKPSSYDGDFFGKGNPLPNKANEQAYYNLNVCVTGALDVARLTVKCDGQTDLGNHLVILRKDEYCSLPLLAGATYEVESDQVIADAFASTKYAKISFENPKKFIISLLLELGFARTNARTGAMLFRAMTSPIDVLPKILEINGACCSCQTNETLISWSCEEICQCNEDWHELETRAIWEGYAFVFFHKEWCPCFLKRQEHSDAINLVLESPKTFFTNNDGAAEDSDITALTAGLLSNIPTNGTLTLSLTDPNIGVNIYESSNRENQVAMPITWDVANGSMRKFYIEGTSAIERGSNAFKLTWKSDQREELLTTNVPFAVYSPIVNVINNTLYDNERLCNPSAIVKGTNACFAVEFDGIHPAASEIVWSVVEGEAEFDGTNVGERVYVRSNVTNQTVKLRIQIGDCKSRPPEISAFVVEPLSVKTTVWIVRDDRGKNAARTPTEVTNMLEEVNKIYEQIGVSFYIDSISFTNREEWLDLDKYARRQRASLRRELVNIESETGGFELYFINRIANSSLANHDLYGIVCSTNANANVISHELGHGFGCADIYPRITRNGIIYSIYNSATCSFAPDDWNNGDGTSYYSSNIKHYDLIRRLLMCGYAYHGISDLSFGSIYGYTKYDTTPGLVDIGFFRGAVRRKPRYNR